MDRLKRNHTGHRIGEGHHRAVHPDSLVMAARSMRQRGLTYGQIALKLNINYWTIVSWCRRLTRWDC